jgi:hypothetical protein
LPEQAPEGLETTPWVDATITTQIFVEADEVVVQQRMMEQARDGETDLPIRGRSEGPSEFRVFGEEDRIIELARIADAIIQLTEPKLTQ